MIKLRVNFLIAIALMSCDVSFVAQAREFFTPAERSAKHDAHHPVAANGNKKNAETPLNNKIAAPVGSGTNQSSAMPANPPAKNRLTPEERRALRRQINDAGQDIYSRHR